MCAGASPRSAISCPCPGPGRGLGAHPGQPRPQPWSCEAEHLLRITQRQWGVDQNSGLLPAGDRSPLSLASSAMVSHKAVAALLVVHVATMLAAQTEAFVPFFTYSELQRMQVRSPAAHQDQGAEHRPPSVPAPAHPSEGVFQISP